MRGLKDKVVIVSGGATLIGAAIARAFVAEGARVTIADIDTRGGGALAAELGECSRFIATAANQGISTSNYLFAVDADNNRVGDRMGGTPVAFVIPYDITPPTPVGPARSRTASC